MTYEDIVAHALGKARSIMVARGIDRALPPSTLTLAAQEALNDALEALPLDADAIAAVQQDAPIRATDLLERAWSDNVPQEELPAFMARQAVCTVLLDDLIAAFTSAPSF